MSVNIKMNALGSKIKEFPREIAETVDETVNRFYDTLNLPDRRLLQNFEVLIDGEFLPKDSWRSFIPNSESVMLIALVPAGGNARSITRTGIVLAVMVAASVFAPQAFGLQTGTAGAAFVSAIAGAAATFAATAILDSLMPLPLGSLEIGGINAEDDSQTYSISSQANAIKKFGPVPKVYGMHRMFPFVAATPYTELAVDPITKETIQYFYAVYDFGLGHYEIQDLKIGDTPITEFIDYAYNIYDPNKPAISNGDWDDLYTNELAYYRGDVSQTDVGAILNGNQLTPGTLPDDYQATRFGDIPEDFEQTITLTFVCPAGLYSVATDGTTAARSIDLAVEFAEVGSNDWRGFSDYSVIKRGSSTVGGQASESTWYIGVGYQVQPNQFTWLLPYWSVLQANQVQPNECRAALGSLYIEPSYDEGADSYTYYFASYGYKQGDNFFYSTNTYILGTEVMYGRTKVGEITAAEAVAGTTLIKHTMDAPFTKSIPVFTQYSRKVNTFFYTHGPVALPSFILTSQIPSGGVFTITADLQRAVFASVTFVPKTKNAIKIRTTRFRDYGGYTYKSVSDLTWLYITTRLDKIPIQTTKSHTFLELKIKATDQLNGAVNNISAVVTSVLDVWNGSTWVKQPTRNPAWAFVDILTGIVNKNAIGKDRLDIDSIYEWSQYCDEIPVAPPLPLNITYTNPRFSFNHIIDYSTTIQEFLNKISSAANASLNIIGGKYGVLIDKNKTTPVQVFTPRNSSGFASVRSYREPPDAFRVAYIDGGNTWEQKEEVVYRDGFDSVSAETFEEIKTFGCINNEQAWRFGRYIMAQGLLRQETINITTDFEYLVCNRGDYVLYQQDAMKVGGRPARVKTVVGNRITIDDAFVTEIGVNYGYTVRSVSGISTSTMDIIDSNSADLNGNLPEVGDLIVWGEVGKVTIDCIVKSITPGADLTAQLTLVEKADAIYSAESTGTLPLYDAQLSKSLDTDVLPPGEVSNLTVLGNTWECKSGGYVYYITVGWAAPEGVVDVYEIYLDSESGYELVDYTTALSYKVLVDTIDLGKAHKIKIIGVAANGLKKSLGEVGFISATPVKKTTPPSDVEAVYINILAETIQLDWDKIPDCDTLNYLIRFSPKLTGTWGTSIPLQTVDRKTSLASFQARTGSYFIKAIDWNGNESVNAAMAITSIPSLVNLNIITETNDFPDLQGGKDRVVVSGTSLLLQEKASGTPGVTEYYSEGYYYFKEFLDLGEIYTVRLQSLIEAEGYTIADIISNWVRLSDVLILTTTRTSDWSVESQYRSTNVFLVMSEWVTLEGIDPISEGQQDDWTNWRRFTIGDYTGRIFQYRLKLISNSPSISPRIIDGVIRSDMPDRRESYSNIITDIEGTDIVYTPAFKGPGTSPNIQVTQDDASQGDYYKLTNKTLTGFTITVYDKDDNPVSRQCDLVVAGYGRQNTVVI